MIGITYLSGDATLPQGDGTKIIAHVCNNIGAWGRGFVLALSNRWSEPERAYKELYKNSNENFLLLGTVQYVQISSELWVANMIAQWGIRGPKNPVPIKYNAVKLCLDKLTDKALELNASVHMPRIGCGLAGGNWREIQALINLTLCQRDVAVYVYDLASSVDTSL